MFSYDLHKIFFFKSSLEKIFFLKFHPLFWTILTDSMIHPFDEEKYWLPLYLLLFYKDNRNELLLSIKTTFFFYSIKLSNQIFALANRILPITKNMILLFSRDVFSITHARHSYSTRFLNKLSFRFINWITIAVVR